MIWGLIFYLVYTDITTKDTGAKTILLYLKDSFLSKSVIRRVATYISESWYTDEVTQPYRRLEKEFIETPNALDGDSIVSGDGS